MTTPPAGGLDLVTVDAMGTIVDLDAPAERLRANLERHGETWPLPAVEEAFRAEVEYYLPRTLEGRDDATLADLRVRCTSVFLDRLGSAIEAEAFAPSFLDAIAFRAVPGAFEALRALGRAGLVLACVSNWDVSLAGQLERAGARGLFATVVSSAEAGAAKPGAAPFRIALDRLAVPPERALHVGDGESDRAGAAAAGIHFEPTPLGTLPERLGLGRTT